MNAVTVKCLYIPIANVDIVSKRSFCPPDVKSIKWFDNIPLIYLI